MGPSWGTTSWLTYISMFDTADSSSLSESSQHYYVANGSVANPPDIMLQPASATAGPQAVAAAVTLSHQYGVPFRMGEINSLYNGGTAGISNAFESALWAIDNMFEYVNVGVDGVNWHGGGNAPYTYFQLNYTTVGGINTYSLTSVSPLYYGLVFFQAATGNGAHLLPVTLNTQANLKTWATIDASGTPRLAIINKDELSSGTVQVTFPGFNTAEVFLLTAPSYQSTAGVTFAGQTFDGSTSGLIQGQQSIQNVAGSNGIFQFPIPITSAELVVFSK